MKSDILFFDIETTGDPDAIEFVEVKAPANYKDPDKIAAYISEAKLDAYDKMALDPDYGKVLCIAYKEGDDQTEVLFDDEKKMLNTFWQLYGEHMQRVCGYNIIGFDLPFLLRRSFALGITIPAMPPMAKYRVEPTIDLMGILYNWQNYKSLKFVCKRYGIKNPLPELNGSMVNDMDNDTLLKYAKNDVDMTYALYNKMSGIYF